MHTVHDDPYVYILSTLAGGLGSCGAPNDGGIHQNFHFIRQGYQRTALGWLRDAALAKDKGAYEVNNSGDVKFQIALSVSLESDVYALQCIREYEKGKLVLWAWASRGYSDCEAISKWHFNGEVSLAQQLMAPIQPGAFAKYVQLHKLPALTILGEESPQSALSVPTTSFLAGEKVHMWFIDCGKEGMVALPHWCSMPIECVIALWKSEHEAWSQKIAERFPKPLPPAQKRQHEVWAQNCTRRLVLDQSTKTEIKTLPATVK